MTLIEWVRCVGTLISFVGTILAAPHAPQRALGRMKDRLTALFSRHRPSVHTGVGVATISLDASARGRAVAAPNSSLEQRVKALESQSASTFAEVGRVGKDLRELNMRWERALSIADAKLKRLDADIAGKEKRALEIDASAFLPLGIGVVLLGLPDAIVEPRWVSITLLVVAAVVVADFLLELRFRRL